MSTAPEHVVRANDALSRGAWTDARTAFEAAPGVEETPEALEARS